MTRDEERSRRYKDVETRWRAGLTEPDELFMNAGMKRDFNVQPHSGTENVTIEFDPPIPVFSDLGILLDRFCEETNAVTVGNVDAKVIERLTCRESEWTGFLVRFFGADRAMQFEETLSGARQRENQRR